MNSVRKQPVSHTPAYKAPAPADYCDEITDEQMKALQALVEEELEGEKPEIVSGPAW